MESWPKRLFILWSTFFFMFIIFLCSKLLLENVNIVQTFDAIPFLLCRLFPCQPLNGIKQIYAQYIWREFFSRIKYIKTMGDMGDTLTGMRDIRDMRDKHGRHDEAVKIPKKPNTADQQNNEKNKDNSKPN